MYVRMVGRQINMWEITWNYIAAWPSRINYNPFSIPVEVYRFISIDQYTSTGIPIKNNVTQNAKLVKFKNFWIWMDFFLSKWVGTDVLNSKIVHNLVVLSLYNTLINYPYTTV